jgi:carbon storage regulator CsrA
MLALTRNVGESVIIAHQGAIIKVRVVKVQGDVVRLAFGGPDEFEFWREEIAPPEARRAAARFDVRETK